MKNKKILIPFLVIMILFMTGCTKQLKNADGKVVQNPETGQTLPSNILCSPTDEDTLEIYRKNREELIEKYDKQLEDGDISKKEYEKKVNSITDVDNIVPCKKFSVTSGGYEGLWTTVFVKPLSWILVQVGKFLGNYSLAIIFVTLLIRLILYPVTIKTARQSENLQKAKPELDKLEKKYANKNDQESMNRKAQEMMLIYNKYKINPLSGCLFSFLQIPLFFAFYEALGRLPILFEDKFLTLEMAVTPIKGMGLYLILPFLVLLVTYFSFKMNQGAGLGTDQAKQMKTMMLVMMGMIFIMSFSMSTAIIFYWITNSGFTIIQNIIAKRSK